ncbi:unnamed protein product [Sphagnum troendelagicum]|uniref:Uncharacterized protein n=1 Tax=Sphagnum troendelagicum TaxID=128251 RepID=A0ABP0TVQ6_9BRYO
MLWGYTIIGAKARVMLKDVEDKKALVLQQVPHADDISSGRETKSIIEDEGLKRVIKYNATNEEYLKVKMDAIRDSRSVC